MAYETPPLELIADVLEENEYPTQFIPASEERPIDQLLVSLGENPEEPILLELTFVNDLLLAMGGQEDYDDAVVLQFLVRFRFSFADSAMEQLALFFMAINRTLPAGAFGFSEREGTIYFMYSLHLESRYVPYEVLMSVMAAIELFVTSFLPYIEGISSGDLDRFTAIQQVEEAGFPVVPMMPGPASIGNPEPDGA